MTDVHIEQPYDMQHALVYINIRMGISLATHDFVTEKYQQSNNDKITSPKYTDLTIS